MGRSGIGLARKPSRRVLGHRLDVSEQQLASVEFFWNPLGISFEHSGVPLEYASQSTTHARMNSEVDTASTRVSRLPVFDENTSPKDMERMMENAQRASSFLKAISHKGRLMILCHLASGEKSVTELEHLLSSRQAAVSQQLTRLRLEGMVKPRRDGKTIYYSLDDDRSKKVMEVVYDLFCRPAD